MSKQKYLTKKLIKNSLKEVLIDSFGVSEEDAKLKTIWLKQLFNDELSAPYFLGFFEEYITDVLGVENTYSFDKIDEFGDVYKFMHNAKDNNELIDYFYKVMIDNYQISPRLTYIKNWTKDNIVELNSWNWWIYYLLGLSLFVFFTMIFVSPPADALVALLGIDTSYSGIFEWVLLFMYLGLPIYISQKNKE